MTPGKRTYSRTLMVATLIACTSASYLQAKEKQPNDSLRILPPPEGVQTRLLFYKPTQYLYIEEYTIHVFGTKTVSPWMMRESHELIRQMVACLKNPEDRKKFSGHEAFLITDEDPDLSQVGGVKGHRNTGGTGYSVFNEVLVCAKAVDSIRPDAPPVYRAWNTPVHEFGHSIELTLGLKSKSNSIFKKNVADYNPKVAREYFAWATQDWFNSNGNANYGRNIMPRWKHQYLAAVFSEKMTWCPGRDPRP